MSSEDKALDLYQRDMDEAVTSRWTVRRRRPGIYSIRNGDGKVVATVDVPNCAVIHHDQLPDLEAVTRL